jgi:oligopeptide/dipeptide ABC transporter ATP-binding protein
MASSDPPLLAAERVTKHFAARHRFPGRRSGAVRAVDGVSLAVYKGETLGLVGESGCGKSTLARCLVRLLEPSSGDIFLEGRNITALSARALRPLRREMQMIFQDPYASLNPRRRVGSIIASPLRVHHVGDRRERRAAVQDLLARVGLSPEHYNRYPHEFSGGQRQRIGIARALALRPKLIVADEPVSALDVSIQAQVLNLLSDLQEDFGLTYVFIAHDLGVVRHISDRIAVMYLGKIVEVSPAEELYSQAIHPYTEALIGAIPIPDPDEGLRTGASMIGGDVPSAIDPPKGCRFHPRCRYATDICRQVEPELEDHGAGHAAACHHPLAARAKSSAH